MSFFQYEEKQFSANPSISASSRERGGGVHLEYEKTKNAYTGLHTLKMSTVSSLISCTISASVQKGSEGGRQKYGCFVLKKMRNQNSTVCYS